MASIALKSSRGGVDLDKEELLWSSDTQSSSSGSASIDLSKYKLVGINYTTPSGTYGSADCTIYIPVGSSATCGGFKNPGYGIARTFYTSQTGVSWTKSYNEYEDKATTGVCPRNIYGVK